MVTRKSSPKLTGRKYRHEQRRQDRKLRIRMTRLIQSALRGSERATEELESLAVKSTKGRSQFIALIKGAPKHVVEALRKQRVRLEPPPAGINEVYNPKPTKRLRSVLSKAPSGLSTIRVPRTNIGSRVISRCRFCPRPAIPGDDVCYDHKPE